MDGDPLPGPDPGHLRPDLRHLARELVAGDQRLADEEVAVSSLEVVVQVRAADAARPHPHLARLRRDGRRGVLLEPEILGLVNDANTHGAFSPADWPKDAR